MMQNFNKKLAMTALASTVAFSGFTFLGADKADAARKGFDPKKVGGKLVMTSFSDAVRLIPYTTSDSASGRIQAMVFDALLNLDQQGNPVPSLATKWSFNKATQTYTFELRKGVKWHDGKPFTADDVVFSYNTFMNPKSINSYISNFKAIGEVKKVDPYKVTIKLKEPNALIVSRIFAASPIIAKHQFPKGVEDFNNNTKVHRNPIGTGAFKFKEWKTDERIVVVANKDYWDGRPYMDEVVTRILPDANVEAINLIKGDVDWVEALTASTVAQVAKDKDLKITKWDYGQFDFVGFNAEKAPFNDKDVRLALTYGLDRQSIVSKLMLGKAYVASGPFHPKIPQYNKAVKPLPFDQKKAAELLDKAGWKMEGGVRQKGGKKMEFDFYFNNGNKVREKIGLLAQQNWGKLGVKVNVRGLEWSIFLDRYAAGELDTFALGWGGYDGNVEHRGFFHSDGIPKSGGVGNNRNRINDPKINKWLDDYLKEEDRNKRIKMYQDMHKYMADNATLIWTVHPMKNMGHDKDLKGIKTTLNSALFNLSDWYWGDPKKRK
ncbi:ABC transporter substrate-binding protein [Bacillus sp. CGMCC 1.16607]|uniref:ABC transporter substrate-binding protein n=1 Tax=Bacillus sp. CGMCC 1.16607 TaxID=3351842 RepID=UPI00362B87B6